MTKRQSQRRSKTFYRLRKAVYSDESLNTADCKLLLWLMTYAYDKAAGFVK
mgnify:CR=1